MGSDPGGPSEAAVEAGARAAVSRVWTTRAFDADFTKAEQDAWRTTARTVLTTAHDPALGTDRSVNEAWCRADQTQRIVERLRGTGFDGATNVAELIAREFGGSDNGK